jgi:hypothetical protein
MISNVTASGQVDGGTIINVALGGLAGNVSWSTPTTRSGRQWPNNKKSPGGSYCENLKPKSPA